jgi:hypothetical protein
VVNVVVAAVVVWSFRLAPVAKDRSALIAVGTVKLFRLVVAAFPEPHEPKANVTTLPAVVEVTHWPVVATAVGSTIEYDAST